MYLSITSLSTGTTQTVQQHGTRSATSKYAFPIAVFTTKSVLQMILRIMLHIAQLGVQLLGHTL